MDAAGHFPALHASFNEWMGAHDEVWSFELLASGEAQIPNRLDVLVYVKKSHDEDTVFCTAGLSEHVHPGPVPRIELGFTVNQAFSTESRQQWARALADFAVVPFRDQAPLRSNMIIEGRTFAPWNAMDATWITDWFFDGEEYWNDAGNRPRIFRAWGLYDDEAQHVLDDGMQAALGYFSGRGIKLGDFSRSR